MWATAWSVAASYWMGPSTGRPGSRAPTSAVARVTFSTSVPDPDAPVEYDSIATRGSIPKAAAACDDAIAMSARSAPSLGAT